MAIRDGQVAWVGGGDDLLYWRGSAARAIDCHGKTLIPGFNDAHIHLLALASSTTGVDCGPWSVGSIQEIKTALASRAKETPAGHWIRGHGYNEFHLRERTHPSRRDLDQVSPEHPLRLDHHTGHACVLNSMALALVGIHRETPDPPGGVIERDDRGEPTGLLLEMNEYVSARMAPPVEENLLDGLSRVNRLLLSMGITSVQDATHTNDVGRWLLFKKAKEAGLLAPRLTFMPGISHLGSFLEEGLAPAAARDQDIHIGATKVMLTATGGALHPSMGELREMIGTASKSGFPVAIHVVEAEALEAVLHVLEDTSINTFPPTRIRIEHCSECPPGLLERLRRAAVTVVTQPAFLYYSGQRYLAQVPDERQPWLYAAGSLQRGGISLAFSSDAPTIPPNPMVGLYSAITRRGERGETTNPQESMAPEDALKAYTLGGASVSGQQHVKGSIERGKRADLIILSDDPTSGEPERLLQARVELTVIGGQVVWES